MTSQLSPFFTASILTICSPLITTIPSEVCAKYRVLKGFVAKYDLLPERISSDAKYAPEANLSASSGLSRRSKSLSVFMGYVKYIIPENILGEDNIECYYRQSLARLDVFGFTHEGSAWFELSCWL